jgi:hypothetical protein
MFAGYAYTSAFSPRRQKDKQSLIVPHYLYITGDLGLSGCGGNSFLSGYHRIIGS